MSGAFGASVRPWREVRELAGRLPQDVRGRIAEHLRASAQAGREAELLWAGGVLEGALARAKEAVTLVVAALEEASAEPPLSPALTEALATDGRPGVEGGWDLDEPLRVLLDGRRRLAARARWLTFDPEAAVAWWWRRWLIRAAVVLAVGLLGWNAVRPRPTVTATGSPGTQRNFEAIYVIDDNPRTEWQTDDHRGGWIELRLDPPRSVAAVRVLNGHNRHYDDRGTKDFQVTYFDERGRQVARGEGSFAAIRPEGEWQRLDLAAPDVARIRFTAESWHGRSPAVGEIVIEYRD